MLFIVQSSFNTGKFSRVVRLFVAIIAVSSLTLNSSIGFSQVMYRCGSAYQDKPCRPQDKGLKTVDNRSLAPLPPLRSDTLHRENHLSVPPGNSLPANKNKPVDSDVGPGARCAELRRSAKGLELGPKTKDRESQLIRNQEERRVLDC